MRTSFVLVALLAACTDPSMSTGSAGGGGKADGPGSSSAPVLAPAYALDLTSTTQLADDRDGSIQTMKLRARARVKTTVAADDTVTLDVRLCDVTLPMVSGYQPELDAAFVAGLAPLHLTGTIDRPHDDPPDMVDAGVAGPTTLVTDPGALVLGAQLAHPLTDVLPGDGASAHVYDQDGDGNPGVSIHVPGYGAIFAAMRVSLTVSVPLGDGTLHGSAEVALDQAIYGDDIWFYDAKSSLDETAAHVQVVSASNAVRLKAGITTCGGVRGAFP